MERRTIALHRLLISTVLLAALIASPLPAAAQDAHPAVTPTATGLFHLLPADAVTEHVLKRPAGDLPYTATAGTIDLRGQDGKVSAKVFHTAYVAKNAPAADEGPSAAELKELRAACDRSEPSKCLRLGRLYEKGEGVKADAAQAADFYGRACSGGYPEGCAALRSLRSK